MNLLSNATICSIITPPGNSYLGGVRISGTESIRIAEEIFIPNSQNIDTSRRQNLSGRVEVIFKLATREIPEKAEAFLYIFIAPKSYTCEDVVEIFTTGSPPLLHALLRRITRAGARLAEAGEFTLRAFLNGRLTLGEAEAVERIIRAETENERQEAVNRLAGQIEKQIADWRQELLFIAGTIESIIDFEDEDIDEDLEADLLKRLLKLSGDAAALADSAMSHRPENSSGVRLVLAGLTNAGKSSLLNALLAEDRAIISSDRSTTRDHTEHDLKIHEINFIIEDCPGIDIESSLIADSASARAKNRFQASNTLLLVIDSSNNDLGELQELIKHIPHCRVIVVLNKNDLPEALDRAIPLQKINEKAILIDVIEVSALQQTGIERLRNTIYHEGLLDTSSSSGIGLSTREADELYTASAHAKLATEVLEMGTEFAAVELREAYEALSRLGGEGYAEEILGNVFSRFCIGK